MEKRTDKILILIGIIYIVLVILFLSFFCPRTCIMDEFGATKICGCDLINFSYVLSGILIYGIPGWILLILGIVFYIRGKKPSQNG